MISVALLRDLSLFAGSGEQDLETMARILTPRSFAKGVLIFHKDGPGDVLYIIRSGRVRIFLPSDDGEEMTLDVYGPGEIFGEMSVLDGRGRSASAMALEPTAVFGLAHADLATQVAAAPPLVRVLLSLLVQRLRHTASYAEALAFLGVNGRVAARLLELSERYGQADGTAGHVELRITQTDLAAWVAASREQVNRALVRFRRRGLIDNTGGQIIVILDRRGLQQELWQG